MLALCPIAALIVAACDEPIELPDAGTPDAGPAVDAGPLLACDDDVHNGDETATDCGGSCPPCVDGEHCLANEDCRSGVCGRSRCLVANCHDMVRNGMETGVDCGGECGLCPGGETCTSNEQCRSNRCRMGMCTMSTCEDDLTNGDETDVDCGGSLCPQCRGGYNCSTGLDCESLICSMGVCTDASCEDGIQNQDETSVDCGGSNCEGCREGYACDIDADCRSLRCFEGGCVSCTDHIRNAEETDIDCGGGGLCPACRDGDHCVVDGDCASSHCVDTDGDTMGDTCQSCSDGVMNQDETDVDCGGSICHGCDARAMCLVNSDCANGSCAPATMTCVNCMDGLLNQDETDVDCGGSICGGCAPTRVCIVNSDCSSMICSGGRCNAPGCGDGVLNGNETALDCGGGSCLGCADGLTCVLGRDCMSGVCTGGICQVPSCTDGVANGLETDIDCGGSSTCPRCMDGRLCPNGPSDCISPLCTSGRCGDVRGHIVLIGHDYFSTNAGITRVARNSVLLSPETGNLDIVIYDQFADTSASGEVANLENAIRSELMTIGRTATFTRLSSNTLSALTTALTPAVDVFIIAEQELGCSSCMTTGATWASTLRAFVSAGGVIMSTNFFDSGWQILNQPSMLIGIGGTGSFSGMCMVAPGATTHPIAAGIMPYAGSSGTSSYTGVTAGSAISVTTVIVDGSGLPVVIDALF
ncbi:MAG: hypothetical protein AB7S26_23150 [Sandaracinaceae bacterium]